jgi:hypothetical protein
MTADRFGIPLRQLLVAAALCAAPLAMVSGCKHDADEPAKVDAQPRPVELNWQEQPLEGVAGGVAAPVPVKEGSIPLVYLTEQAQVVQVIDRTANKSLGQAEVPARTIIRVNERLGVVAGKHAIFAGSLDRSHRFAILVVPQGQAVVRSGQYQPVAPPRLEQKGPTGETQTPPTGADVTDLGKEPK